MVQLNPVPVFGARKNTTNIWRKFFTEIPVQMVSAHKEMRTRLGWTISYKALYFVHQSPGLVPLFVYNNNSWILCSVAEMQSVSALLLNSRSENKRMAVLPVQTVKTNQCFWKKKCSKYINDVLWRSCIWPKSWKSLRANFLHVPPNKLWRVFNILLTRHPAIN